MPLLDHFGWIAPHCDRLAGERDGAPIKELLDLKGKGVLVDLGGGTGRAGRSVQESVESVLVVDESFRMLAQTNDKPGLAAVCARSEALPFESGRIDYLLMVDAFHHVADQEKTVDEMLRVLHPSGRLVIEEPDIRTVAVKLIAFGERILGMRSRFLTGQAIAGLFAGRRARTYVRSEGHAVWVTAERH